MRAGVKESHNKSLIILWLLEMLLILICGIFLYTIFIPKQNYISLNVSTKYFFDNIPNVSNNFNIAQLLEEEKNNSNSYINQDYSSIFIKEEAMVIGDSTAEGLTAYGILDPSSVVFTRGRTIQDIEKDFNEILKYKPKILFIAYGANDLLSWNGNVDGYINAYNNAINLISLSLPDTKIYINSVLPVSSTAIKKNSAYKYELLFNAKLKEFCETHGITYIDNKSLLKQNNGEKVYESDGVHPRPFYYKLWAGNMVKELEKNIQKSSKE